MYVINPYLRVKYDRLVKLLQQIFFNFFFALQFALLCFFLRGIQMRIRNWNDD